MCLLGIILTIVHSMALGYSAMIIIIERNEGLLDRTWVAGVTAGEFALAHFIVSLVVNLLQVIVTLVFMILIFQVRSNIWLFDNFFNKNKNPWLIEKYSDNKTLGYFS